MLLTVRDLPPDLSLEVHSMLPLKHLLATILSAAPSAVPPPLLQFATSVHQHVMLSHCWGAKKGLGFGNSRQPVGYSHDTSHFITH